VYAPKGEEFICIEPISHFPNAINVHPALSQAHGGLAQLAPDEVWSTRSMFRITPFRD
jgi:galactose mutarotase-like enzyme